MPPLPALIRRRLRRVSPWVAVTAGVAGTAIVVRVAADFGSPAFLAGRAVVFAAVSVALVVAWRGRTIARRGWRVVLLPCAAVALYRAVWEGLRVTRAEPPLWLLAAGLPLAGWVVVAAARGVVRELWSGFATPPR